MLSLVGLGLVMNYGFGFFWNCLFFGIWILIFVGMVGNHIRASAGPTDVAQEDGPQAAVTNGYHGCLVGLGVCSLGCVGFGVWSGVWSGVWFCLCVWFTV